MAAPRAPHPAPVCLLCTSCRQRPCRKEREASILTGSPSHQFLLLQLRCSCSNSTCMCDFVFNFTRALHLSACSGRPHADKLPGSGKPRAPVLHCILLSTPCRIPPWSFAVVVRFWTSQTCLVMPPCQSPWPVLSSSPGGAEREQPGVMEHRPQGPQGPESPRHLP